MSVKTPDKTIRLYTEEEIRRELFGAENPPSERWWRDQCKNGKLPRKVIGGRVFFDLTEVREAIDRRFTR